MMVVVAVLSKRIENLDGPTPAADHGWSEPVLHVESRNRSLLIFCSGVHQISWSWRRVVDADSFINLMRHRIFEEPLCLERELAFFSLVEKLLMFIKSVVLLSCLQARLVLVLPSNEASMRPSMILWADWLVFAVNLFLIHYRGNVNDTFVALKSK